MIEITIKENEIKCKGHSNMNQILCARLSTLFQFANFFVETSTIKSGFSYLKFNPKNIDEQRIKDALICSIIDLKEIYGDLINITIRKK